MPSGMAFATAVAVPIHNGDRVSGFDTERRQGIGQSANPFTQGLIVETYLVSVDYLLPWIIDHRIFQQVFDQ